MSKSKLLLALAMAAGAAACARAGMTAPSDGALAKVSLGRCFAAGGIGCQSNSGCQPPFATCQEGTCCSGEFDPSTCVCHCGGGAACRSTEWCCKGDPKHVPPVAKLGVLMCRPESDCLDNGP